MMTQCDTSTRTLKASWPREGHAIVFVLVACSLVLASVGTAAAQWDFPFDHELSLRDPNLCTHTTTYGPDEFAWTSTSRVLAIQPLGVNYDVIVNEDAAWPRVSQHRGKEVEFVLFDASTLNDEIRHYPETTVDVYTNGNDRGMYYMYYVEAVPLQWDGRRGQIDLKMYYYEMVAARTLYLKAGVAYRFDIDRTDGRQAGFASLMRTDPQSRIQTRPQAVAEFGWRGEQHDDFVYVPEEGWYTLVIVQENGEALGLGTVQNTVRVARGEDRVDENDIRITITTE
jgi:hypothetical protein